MVQCVDDCCFQTPGETETEWTTCVALRWTEDDARYNTAVTEFLVKIFLALLGPLNQGSTVPNTVYFYIENYFS